jgi:hypothetical protein
LEQRKTLRPLHQDLTHVADVKKARLVSHRQMFLDDARVFDGHFPAAKLGHFGAETPMSGVKTRFL